jgi:hypothetical protein
MTGIKCHSAGFRPFQFSCILKSKLINQVFKVVPVQYNSNLISQRGKMNNDCIFCKMAKGEMKTRVIYEDENTLGIVDITVERLTQTWYTAGIII